MLRTLMICDVDDCIHCVQAASRRVLSVCSFVQERLERELSARL